MKNKFVLTEDHKNEINEALHGMSSFCWRTVNEILGVEDAEELFLCGDADIMSECDLEYCEECGWIFSTKDGYGESENDDILCSECSEKEDE